MGKSGKKQRQQQKPPRGSYFPQEEDDEGYHHYHYSDETLQSSSRGIDIEDDKEVEDEDEVQEEEDGADPNPLTDDMPSKFLLYQQSVQVTTHSWNWIIFKFFPFGCQENAVKESKRT